MSDKEQKSSNNTKILKNTIFLYFRMIVVSLVSIYTVRVVLNVLGQEDYGIYNLIAGVVGFLNFISVTLTSATQRFLSFELGKDPKKNKFSGVFSISIEIFFLLAISLAVFSEIFLPLLIKAKLVIPGNRLDAALCVLHFSIATFCLNLITIPFQAAIVAYERMSFYAYLSIIEAISKLVIVFLLQIINDDKLIVYAYLSFSITLIIAFCRCVFCKRKLPLCKFSFQWDKNFNKRFASFIGWNSFGAITSIFTIQGMTMIINIFFGPIVNAAKAIADKINSVLLSLVSNIILAASPQETKLIATGNKQHALQVFCSISKLSFFLIFTIAIPVLILMPKIIVLWLGAKESSTLMVIFSRITIIGILFSALESPMSMLVRAVGTIKKYQISSGIISISAIPFTIAAYKLGAPVYSFSIIQSILLFISLFVRIKIIKELISEPFSYYDLVVKPILTVSIPSIVLMILIHMIHGKIQTILAFLLPLLFICPLVYYVGLTVQEKKYVTHLFKRD